MRHNPFYFGRLSDLHMPDYCRKLTNARPAANHDGGMCSRYSQTKEKFTLYVAGIEIEFGFVARYNIAPAQKVGVIVEEHGEIKSQEMRWGWKPSWSKSLLINAQGETLREKPTFSKYIHQRCLVPADGFYEWTADKTPIRFTKPHNGVFCLAGLWLETLRQEQDVPIAERKFVIVTTTPNDSVRRVHNRMPLIVQPKHYDWWLSRKGLAESVLGAPDREELWSQPVNRALNNPRNEGPDLLIRS